ncbi:hypothetical protein CPC08DRAFT_707723 [Agrocybe pediades]|nr:hypothetical protein CPC08DRAFT_707723 [Agrocybe pediades]
MPLFAPNTISPFKTRNADLLSLAPRTENERRLQEALFEAEERDTKRKMAMVTMQGVAVLQNIYVRKANKHLHAQEEERKKKSKKNRIFGDGMAKLLHEEEIFNKVIALDEEAKRKAEEKEDRRLARENHAQALADWKKHEDLRKERNAALRETYHEALAQWEKEREVAKVEKRRPRWNKPKLGAVEKATPRPKKPMLGSDEEDDYELDDGERDGEGMDED